MSMLAPSEAPNGTLLILASGAGVLPFTEALWPVALLWVGASIMVLIRGYDETPDPSGRERIGDLT